MKYQIKRMTPEFKAIGYSMLVSQFFILLGLYLQYISIDLYFYGYSILLLISLIVSHYQTDFVEENQVTL